MESEQSERTEDPTSRKLSKAREDGQIARSKELGTALTGMASAAIFLTFGSWIIDAVATVARNQFSLTRSQIFDVKTASMSLKATLETIALPFLPYLIGMFIVAIAGSIMVGGWNFSLKAMAVKWNKMSPAKGFARMFGVKGLMELVKSIAKFFVVAGFATTVLWLEFGHLMELGNRNPKQGMAEGLELVGFMFLIISTSLILIALIDVPFQIWNHKRQLKMTKQEVKDEMKDTEGKPEVKQKIRRTQMEMLERRMMSSVPEADVVITNPEHYAVALKYDQDGTGAPMMVAKGVDLIAQQIKKVALANEVPIVEAPPLARAIYFTTEIDREIPQELYIAVAQVLAYVYQLEQFKKGKSKRPKFSGEVPIPESMQY